MKYLAEFLHFDLKYNLVHRVDQQTNMNVFPTYQPRAFMQIIKAGPLLNLWNQIKTSLEW